MPSGGSSHAGPIHVRLNARTTFRPNLISRYDGSRTAQARKSMKTAAAAAVDDW